MRVPPLVLNYLQRTLLPLAGTTPDEIIGPGYRWRKKNANGAPLPSDLDRPFLHRWFLRRKNTLSNWYLHCFMRNDEDRALHDHPWWNVSLLLKGQYIEVTREGRKLYTAGCLKFRWASTPHRIELVDGVPCWSLFITGPVERKWGFHCPRGWVEQKEFHERQGCD